MKKLVSFAIAALCAAISLHASVADYKVVPLPQTVTMLSSSPYVLKHNAVITYTKGDDAMRANAEFLKEFVADGVGINLRTRAVKPGAKPAKGAIALVLDTAISGYTIAVDASGVTLAGGTAEDVFRAVQTLRKSLPLQLDESPVMLPAVRLADAPRFAYRGMHFDVSRHFFPKDFIKKYIDILALHGLNTFHWHLTDNQGWRVEIKRYPRLTEGVPHYTQDEVREVVEYAAARYVNVIPEIDLPGHMAAALQAYPELTCTGHQHPDPAFGNLGSVLCLGSEKTYEFIEGVMEELVQIFPSEVIHVGGDEASRSRWKLCPLCQEKIRTEHLDTPNSRFTPEDRLQSYCMARVGDMLKRLGRRFIGWDEVLDGNPIPDATIMIWRDPKSAKIAHERGNKVIMSPGTHCYFDFYQTSNTESEPVAFGGYLPVERVYSFEPTAGLDAAEAADVIGCQANLWTECVPTPEHAEYMLLPRLAALAEVQWCQAGSKDYKGFVKRLYRLLALYDKQGYNYSRHLFDVQCSLRRLPEQGAVEVTLSNIDGSPIYYTLDGSTPTTESIRYAAPFKVDHTARLCATTIRDADTNAVPPTLRSLDFGKSTYKSIVLDETYLEAPRYAYDGKITLVDGIRGKLNFGSGEWMGFVGGNTAATIDFGTPTEISSASTACLIDLPSWIMGCSKLILEISDDGTSFKQIDEKSFPLESDVSNKAILTYELSFEPVVARFARLTIVPSPDFPANHDGHGTKPYMFVDEVIIK